MTQSLEQLCGKCLRNIPPTLLSIIRSFHEGMKASVRLKGNISDGCEVCNVT